MTKSEHNAPVIRLGVTDLSFHRATAAVVSQVLQRLGYEVQISHAAHEANFSLLHSGAVDMLASAWLPHSHGVYLQSVNSDVATRELGLHYQPYALWGVPEYVPASAVSKLEDLLKPAVAARMQKIIQGIGPGAGISRFSLRIFERYSLAKAGYEFRNGSEQDCANAFKRLVAAGEWGVVPLWHPQFLHHRHTIRALKDPEGLLGAVDRAVLLVREDRLALLMPEHIQVLDNIRLSNAIVAELDYAINCDQQDADSAAVDWLNRNPQTLASWLAPLGSTKRSQP